jgi:Zn-dependent metalloprotease
MYCALVPPHLLDALATSHESPEIRLAAVETVRQTGRLTGLRAWHSLGRFGGPAERSRRVYDAQAAMTLPGVEVATEHRVISGDPDVLAVHTNMGEVWAFLADVLGWTGLDRQGMEMLATVNYGQKFDNLFWNGMELVCGRGDGVVFRPFTPQIEVVAHELGHAMTSRGPGLVYHGESGWLNEAFSDVFGCVVKQWILGQTVDQASWLIGGEAFFPGVRATAIRSLAAPGTAYNDPVLGRDPQPATWSDRVLTDKDDGGAHINSSIPANAFYRLCVACRAHGLTPCSWEIPFKLWLAAHMSLHSYATVADFVGATIREARLLDAKLASGLTEAVAAAWAAVGLS